ncbi:metallophosphoesterase [Microcystis sp. M061S2]|uniref:metallophosphoesterase n=1 Tax=Microcystis sp. M061S2 TaxID=2771171 RepID=UPI00258296EE|nr:metallophosphoesterase [Microcystis sp. M061S2]MCA2654532.1 metallophosphoesterase [Microcystis sp. M061S2]
MTHIVSGFPVTVMSDLHCPMHDAELIYKAVKVARHFESKILILNGDVMDLNQISRHAGGYYRRKAEMEDDFAAAESLLKVLSQNFETIYWLSGNHCIERLVKLFRGEVQASRVLKMVGDFPNLKITSRSFLDVNEAVRICHPRQYGRVRGSLAQRLAQRWQKHIATGHQHHAAMSYSPDGKWQAVDIPCMVKVGLQDYVRNELNDFPEPMIGFGMVFGNYIQVFTPDFPFTQFGVSL